MTDKNLEQDYKEMMMNEIPDLKDRIFSSLPEKNVISEEDAYSGILELAPELRFNSKIRLTKTAGIIIACACAVIIASAVIFSIGRGGSIAQSASESSDQKTAMAESPLAAEDYEADGYAAAAAAEEYEEGYVDLGNYGAANSAAAENKADANIASDEPLISREKIETEKNIFNHKFYILKRILEYNMKKVLSGQGK